MEYGWRGGSIRKKFAALQQIDNGRKITPDSDYEFLYQLQTALLLALRERGTLNAMQYRQAEEKLKQQRRNRAKRLMERESE